MRPAESFIRCRDGPAMVVTSPGGPAGGIRCRQYRSGIIPGGGLGVPGSPSERTAEQMDLGQLPSLSASLPGEAMATLGGLCCCLEALCGDVTAGIVALRRQLRGPAGALTHPPSPPCY
jgi:hypothetical protein